MVKYAKGSHSVQALFALHRPLGAIVKLTEDQMSPETDESRKTRMLGQIGDPPTLADYNLDVLKQRASLHPLMCLTNYEKTEVHDMILVQYDVEPRTESVPFASLLHGINSFSRSKYFDKISGEFLGSTRSEALAKKMVNDQKRIVDSTTSAEAEAKRQMERQIVDSRNFSNRFARMVLQIDFLLLCLWLSLHPFVSVVPSFVTSFLVLAGNSSSIMTLLAGYNGFETAVYELKDAWIFQKIRLQFRMLIHRYSLGQTQSLRYELQVTGIFMLIGTIALMCFLKLVQHLADIATWAPATFSIGLIMGIGVSMVHFLNSMNDSRIFSTNMYVCETFMIAAFSLMWEQPFIFTLGFKAGILAGFVVCLLMATGVLCIFMLQVVPRVLKWYFGLLKNFYLRLNK